MCGLIGMAGDLSYKDESLIRRMFWFSALQRGDDATGLAVIENGGTKIQVAKAVGPPNELFDTTRFRTIFNAYRSKLMMGHTRKATVGEKTKINAHPFEYGNIVGAHNGTLDPNCVRDISKELKEDFTVDSQALIAAIAAMGPKDAISMARGAWSLVWYDSSDDSLYFLRNDQRPMFIAWAEDRKTLFWASEIWMIDVACSHVTPSRKLYEAGRKKTIYYDHAPNTLYRYPLRDILNPPQTGLYKPTVRKIEGKAAAVVPFVSPYENERPRPFAEHGREGTRLTSTSSTTTHGHSGNGDNVSVLSFPVKKGAVPYGGAISKTEFETLNGGKCSFCETPIEFGTVGIQIYLEDKGLNCPSCSRSDNTQIHVYDITEDMVTLAKINAA